MHAACLPAIWWVYPPGSLPCDHLLLPDDRQVVVLRHLCVTATGWLC